MKKNEILDSRASHLVRDALAVQLNLLHRFLPMRGWIVARCEESAIQMIAMAGDLTAASAARLAHRFLCGTRAYTEDGFEYRPCSEIEAAALSRESPVEWRVTHLFRADLALPGSGAHACVLGLQSQARALPLRSGEVDLCLTAVLRTLHLHEELVETEKKMHVTRQEASLDALTGALNRAGWDNHLRQIDAQIGEGADAVVGILDLDFLKSINDRFGHAAGDQALKLTARTIHSVLRRRDCVARLGGDEFAILLPHVTPRDADRLKARLATALQQADISASIGFAMKSESGTLDEAIKLADARMYQSKRNRLATYQRQGNAHACLASA